MNHSEDTHEEIDAYLNGTLTPDERSSFEHRMSDDADLQREVEKQRLLIEAIRHTQQRRSLKQSFSAFHDTIEPLSARALPFTPASVSSPWRMIGIAASVAIISIIATWMGIQSFQSDTAKYMDLKLKVEQISKSQNEILQDIAEANKKEEAIAARFTGTGFLISPAGYIATSYHLIREADSIFVQNEKFGTLKTSVIKTDQVNDVAILKIEDVDFQPTTLPYLISGKQADLGEIVYTLGFPREEIVYGEGTISAATGYKQNVTAYQVAVPVNPGNSGGPLLDQQGNIVGMISGIQTKTQGAAFAVKSGILLDVISNISYDSTAKQIQLPRTNRLKSLSRVQQVKKIRDYVFVVKVYDQP
jgi:serine protease Do